MSLHTHKLWEHSCVVYIEFIVWLPMRNMDHMLIQIQNEKNKDIGNCSQDSGRVIKSHTKVKSLRERGQQNSILSKSRNRVSTEGKERQGHTYVYIYIYIYIGWLSPQYFRYEHLPWVSVFVHA